MCPVDLSNKQRVIVADSDAMDRFIKTDNTHILPALYDRVIIPEQVYKELTNAETPQKVREWVERQTNHGTWLRVAQNPLVNPNPEKSRGWGEKQAIALAHQYQSSNLYESTSILLEDRFAIAQAEQEKLHVNRGLLLLDEADRMGLIKSLPQEIKRLQDIPIDYKNETVSVEDRIVPLTEALEQRHYERQEMIRQLAIRSVPSNEPNRKDFIASFPSGEHSRFSVSGLRDGDDVKELMTFTRYEQLKQQAPGGVLNLTTSAPELSQSYSESRSCSHADAPRQTHSIKM